MLPRLLATVLILAALTAPALCEASLPVITRGERVDLQRHLVPGKLVLVDFYADWCGPCRALEPELERLARRHDDRLAVLKVDVVGWSSPVTQQYGIRAVPHLKLYDERGGLLAEGNAGAVLAALDRRLGGAGAGAGSADGIGAARERSPVVPAVAVVAVLATAALLVGRRRGGATSRPAAGSAPLVASGPSDPPQAPASGGWFAMIQGSLDGPFTVDELSDLIRRGVLARTARVRRRGDRDWRPAADVLDEA